MHDAVLFDELTTGDGHRIAIATLNAEKSLNALTLDMIRLLDARLTIWERDEGIVAVVLRGAGERAFCAGGDVRSLRGKLIDEPHYPNPHAVAFFTEEYTLDYRIHRYRKPLIVWGAGIVMGGGLGLMAGAGHRVVTPATRIAMPEITIGLYPDVGGSWFLQRMPAHLGLFLALTGAPLNAHDALIANLADHVLAADAYPALLEALQAANWGDAHARPALVSALLNQLEGQLGDALPASNVERNLLAVHRLMNKGDLAAVSAALTETAFEDQWLADAAKNFVHGCPTSAAVSWEILNRSKHMSLAEALRMELVLSINFCARSDFPEGVRALLVDKDRKPHWSRQLQDIDQALVDGHFESPWRDGDHPLASLK